MNSVKSITVETNSLDMFFFVIGLELALTQFALFIVRRFLIMNSKLQDKHTDSLFDAILLLENREECYKFFEDISTISEIKALAQRLEVAKMLRNKRTYTDISEQTGASTATISRVNRCLVYRADGYNLVLDRLEEKDK